MDNKTERLAIRVTQTTKAQLVHQCNKYNTFNKTSLSLSQYLSMCIDTGIGCMTWEHTNKIDRLEAYIDGLTTTPASEDSKGDDGAWDGYMRDHGLS